MASIQFEEIEFGAISAQNFPIVDLRLDRIFVVDQNGLGSRLTGSAWDRARVRLDRWRKVAIICRVAAIECRPLVFQIARKSQFHTLVGSRVATEHPGYDGSIQGK